MRVSSLSSNTSRVWVIVNTLVFNNIRVLYIMQELSHFLEKYALVLIWLIAHPHLLARATSERFLLAWAIFRVGLASESYWM